MLTGEAAEPWTHPGCHPWGRWRQVASTEWFLTPSSASSLSLVPRSRMGGGKVLGLVGGLQILLSAEDSYRELHAAPGSPLPPGLARSSMFLVAAMTNFSVPCSSKCGTAATWQRTVIVWFEAFHDCTYTSKTSLLDPYLGAVARQSGCSPRPPTTSRPGTTQWSANAGRSSNTRLLYGGCPFSDPTVSNELFPEDDSSDLTHGNVWFLILFFPTPPPPSECYYC